MDTDMSTVDLIDNGAAMEDTSSSDVPSCPSLAVSNSPPTPDAPVGEGGESSFSKEVMEEEERAKQENEEEENAEKKESTTTSNEEAFDALDQLLEKASAYSGQLRVLIAQHKIGFVAPTAPSEAEKEKESKKKPTPKKSSKKKGSKKSTKDKEEAEAESLKELDKVASSETQQGKLSDDGFTQSEFLKADLKAHQKIGVKWLITLYENCVNGILADEMGLGKTVQTIGLFAYVASCKVPGRILVVAPLSTLRNWVNEMKRFAPEIPVTMYHGTKPERASIRAQHFSTPQSSTPISTSASTEKLPLDVENGGSTDEKGVEKAVGVEKSRLEDTCVLPHVFVTSYEIANNDKRFLKAIPWEILVVDEAHRMKNFNCLLVQNLKTFDTSFRLLLTGTPLQNNLKELWSLLNFNFPKLFHDPLFFEKWLEMSTDESGQLSAEIIAQEKSSRLIQKLQSILTPFFLRRIKKDVDINLPPKKDVILHAPMSDLQKEYYAAALKKELPSFIAERCGESSVKIQRLSNVVMQLRKCCLHPLLFEPKIFENSENENENCENKSKRPANFMRYSRDDLYGRKDNWVDSSESGGESGCESEGEGSSPAAGAGVGKKRKGKVGGEGKGKKTKKAKSEEPSQSLSDEGQEKAPAAKRGTRMTRSKSAKEREETKTQKMEKEKALQKSIMEKQKMGPTDPAQELASIVEPSGKMVLLDRMLTKLHSKGHRVLIFTQMVKMLEILRSYVELKGYKHCALHGSTSQPERQAQIDAFNSDPSYFVFLLSTKAGGLGINLTGADTVIFFDGDWNPQNDLQAEARCHRIGQTKPVAVYHLVVNNSIEQKMLETAKGKRKLERLIIHEKGFKDPSSFGLSEKDLLEALTLDSKEFSFGSGITDEWLEKLLDERSTEQESVLQPLKREGGEGADLGESSMSEAAATSTPGSASSEEQQGQEAESGDDKVDIKQGQGFLIITEQQSEF